MVINLLEELIAATKEKEKGNSEEETASLKEENMRLNEEKKKVQKAFTSRIDRLLGIIQGKPSSSKKSAPQSS